MKIDEERKLEWELANITNRLMDHYRWIHAKPGRSVNVDMITEDFRGILLRAGIQGDSYDE